MSADPLIGKVLDGYRILGILGKGGMGVVYKAEDVALSRIVAMKMISQEMGQNEAFMRRFHSEARALARVESPYIVGVHALRKVGDQTFIVMEFIDGHDLADELHTGAMSAEDTLPIVIQMAQALAAAHGAGVIHRDIKPRNIMLTQRGTVKVTDFGLAKLRRTDGGNTTVTNTVAGTVFYMSPEQVQASGKIDHRADIYSLGMTMYEMLTGRVPFDTSGGIYAAFKQIVEKKFPPPSEYNPDILPELEAIILKCIEKNPEDRFQNAGELVAELQPIWKRVEAKMRREQMAETGLHPEAQTFTESDPPQPRQKRSLRGAMAVLSLALIGLVVVAFTTDIGREYLAFWQAEPVGPSQPAATPPTSIDTTPVQSEVEPASLDTALTVASDSSLLTSNDPGSSSSSDNPGGSEGNGNNQPPAQTTSSDPVENPPIETQVMGSLTVRSDAGRTLRIGTELYDLNAVHTIPAGEHRIEITDGGGSSCVGMVNVLADDTTERTCYFEHFITILAYLDGEPIDATIRINDELLENEFGDLRKTPQSDLQFASGVYEIKVSKFGYDVLEASQTVRVEPTFDPEAIRNTVRFTLRKQ